MGTDAPHRNASERQAERGYPGLQIDEPLAFQRRSWPVQRVGWALMAFVIVAALLGLFGPGPLSHSTVTSPDRALQVDYQRFARRGGPVTVSVEAGADLIRDGRLQLAVDADFLDSVPVEQIMPTPSDVVAREGATVFTFAVEGRPRQVTVDFSVRPDAIGSVEARVSVPGGPELGVPQFFYP